MAKTTQIARLEITLMDVEPKVLRCIDVPLTIKLDRLHQVIQAAMPWTNSHLSAFEAGETTWADPAFGLDHAQPTTKMTLKGVLDEIGGKALCYVYDYGDNWEHMIVLKGIHDSEPDVLYPHLVKAEGRCPLEDIGGFPGYDRYLEIMANPEHEEYDEMVDWYGEPEDPKVPELDTINALLGRLAQRWKPRSKKPNP